MSYAADGTSLKCGTAYSGCTLAQYSVRVHEVTVGARNTTCPIATRVFGDTCNGPLTDDTYNQCDLLNPAMARWPMSRVDECSRRNIITPNSCTDPTMVIDPGCCDADSGIDADCSSGGYTVEYYCTCIYSSPPPNPPPVPNPPVPPDPYVSGSLNSPKVRTHVFPSAHPLAGLRPDPVLADGLERLRRTM